MSFGYRDEDWIYPDYEPPADNESCIEISFDGGDIVSVVDGDTGYTELEFDADGVDDMSGETIYRSDQIENIVWDIIDKLLPVGPDGEFVDGNYELTGHVYMPYSIWYHNDDSNYIETTEIDNDLKLTKIS